jgi:hypothetical protein
MDSNSDSNIDFITIVDANGESHVITTTITNTDGDNYTYTYVGEYAKPYTVTYRDRIIYRYPNPNRDLDAGAYTDTHADL